ncbi:MAG TPA: energy transducer TonB [Vicinamibacterales bacterium]|jgi:protein TonB
MFDLISGGPRHPFHDRTMTPQVVAVSMHVVMLIAIVLPLLYATDRLPEVKTITAFVADVAPPPPPPPPPAPAPRRGDEARPQPVQTAGAFAAPLEAPAEIRPEPAGLIGSEGVEGGVEGGIAGGVVGGIVGGLVAAPPPPPPPPPPPAVARGPVRIGGDLQAPALVKRVEPVYPDLAVAAKITGIVILEATVGGNGAVEQVRVLRSVKFLDQAAIEAVKQWKYSPLVLNGVPTPFVLTVTLSFSLKQG